MYKYEVGKPYVEGKTRWPEASFFSYDKAGLVLTIFASRLKEPEIEAVRRGQVELALYENQPTIFLLYKIRGWGQWSDSPFTIHLVKPEDRPEIKPIIGEGQKLLLMIILVGADTGIIKVLRAVSTSTEFTIVLNHAVMRQLEQEFDRLRYNLHIDNLYSRYSSDQMLAMTDYKYRAGE